LVRRTKRMKQPWHVDRKLEEIGKARSALVSIQTEVIINSDLYRAAGKAMTALDEVAKEITGKEDFFAPVHRY